MSALEVLPAGPVSGELAAPASKSVTNRLLLMAALATGDSVLRAPLHSDDSAAMQAAIAAFGATVREDGDSLHIHGTGGRLRSPHRSVSSRLSGTTMRFVAGLATLAPGGGTITGEPPLLRRPIGSLSAALAHLGADVHDDDGFPPFVAKGGGLAGGTARIDATASSQFASAVLLVAPYARTDVTLIVEGTVADGYIDLTAQLMTDWGALVRREDRLRWHVRGGDGYTARDRSVEYDASAAAHLFAIAAATGGTVTVTNAADGSRQPDAAFTRVLASMGCAVARDASALTVTGPASLSPVEVDLAAMPDQVTTVAALAAMARGTTTITGAAVTRGHETDRLAALAGELAKLGVGIEEHADGLVIHGGSPRGPARLATHDDHRLAMAFAALAARVPGITIQDPGCVAKTYPGFWADLTGMGVPWRDR